MPYFIYRISPKKNLSHLEDHAIYRNARDRAREMRAQEPSDSTDIIKIIFAKSKSEAEKMLLVEREARPLGEELG